METTIGYQIRFLRDDYGKLIKKKGQNGTYKDVGVSFDLIYHQDIKHSFKINPFIFVFVFLDSTDIQVCKGCSLLSWSCKGLYQG